MRRENYVTLLDVNYLPQLLALRTSLHRHSGNFRLWVICADELVYDFLTQAQLQGVKAMRLADFETPELLKVKLERAPYEYYWTLTPFLFDFVFKLDSRIGRVTYLDADLWFRAAPDSIFESFQESKKSVLITAHAFSEDRKTAVAFGRFNVQFLTMERIGSHAVKQWWQERCLEWCFARLEEGRYGDQKYLDKFPELFPDETWVAEPAMRFQGPWNANRFVSKEAITYHFHSLRLLGRHRLKLYNDTWIIPSDHKRNTYLPYVSDFGDAMLFIHSQNRLMAKQIARDQANVKTVPQKRELGRTAGFRVSLRLLVNFLPAFRSSYKNVRIIGFPFTPSRK